MTPSRRSQPRSCAAGASASDSNARQQARHALCRLALLPQTSPSSLFALGTAAVTAVVAAFVCLFPGQPLEATAHALAYFGCVWAAPGSFPFRVRQCCPPKAACQLLGAEAAAACTAAYRRFKPPARLHSPRGPCLWHAPQPSNPPLLALAPRTAGPQPIITKQPLSTLRPAALLSCCSLAAELAAADGAKGPGSLRVGLLDNLWAMSKDQLLAGTRVSEA